MNHQLFEDINNINRIRKIDKIDEFDMTQVKKGILSIHAYWSKYSVMYGKSILNLIDNSKSNDFEIIIIDIDSISTKKQIEFIGNVCHGYFESVWIENGKIKFNYQDNNQMTELYKFKDYLKEKISK